MTNEQLDEWVFDQKAKRDLNVKTGTKSGGRIHGLKAADVLARAQALADADGKKKGTKKKDGKFMMSQEHINRAKAELRVDMSEDFDPEILEEGWNVKIGDEYHPREKVPIAKYDQFRKEHHGATIRFRGPRGKSENTRGYKAHTIKANATHFYVVNTPNGMTHDSDLKESLAGEARGAEHDFAMNGGSDNSSGSSVSKPSHAVKVGSTHFHPGKKGMGMAVQRAKALGVKPQIVKHPGGPLLGEAAEQSELIEGKLPDWAQAEFDSAFKKSPAAKRRPDNDEHDVARFNPKTDGKYKVAQFAKGRVHKGSYGKAVIDHDDEHPADAPEKHPATALDSSGINNNPMVPKVRTSAAQKAAGPQRPKGKAATPEAMKAYRIALRNHNMKKESYVYDGSEFVQIDEKISVSHPAFKLGYKHAKKDPVDGYANYDDSEEGAKNYNAGFHRGVKDSNKNKQTNESMDNEIVLEIIKTGQLYNYEISYGDQILSEGIGATVQGIIINATRKMSHIVEDVQQKDGQLDRIKSIVKKYI